MLPGADLCRQKRSTCRQKLATCRPLLQHVEGDIQLVARYRQHKDAERLVEKFRLAGPAGGGGQESSQADSMKIK